LRALGCSTAQVARELGLDPSTVTVVSQGHRTSHRVQDALAKKLGTTPEALFPERYVDMN
jgi:lambda repressor-like predicted transcriptional regulator